MYFVVYFVGILSFFAIGKCNSEQYGNATVNIDDQEDDGSLNGISLRIDKSDINKGHPSSWKLRKNKCRKTKRACKVSGGECQAKGDDCDGELLEGKKYCFNKNTCGCCVPEDAQSCRRGADGVCAPPVGNYKSKYIDSFPVTACECILDHNGNLYKAECNPTTKKCRFMRGNVNTEGACGGACKFNDHFQRDHVCAKTRCIKRVDAEKFCNDNTRLKKKYKNTVFIVAKVPVPYLPGVFDWALNEKGQMEKVCMIMDYVSTTFCSRDNLNDKWSCSNLMTCTGGGTIGSGHFIQKSLDCKIPQ